MPIWAGVGHALGVGDVALPTGQGAEACVDALVQGTTDIGEDWAVPRWHSAPVGVVRRHSIEYESGAPEHVRATEHDSADTAQQQRAETHQTRFEARVAGHLPRPRPQPERYTRKRFLLSVTSRLISLAQNTSAALSHDLVIEGDQAANRNISASFSLEGENDCPLDQFCVSRSPIDDATNPINRTPGRPHDPRLNRDTSSSSCVPFDEHSTIQAAGRWEDVLPTERLTAVWFVPVLIAPASCVVVIITDTGFKLIFR